MGTFVLYSPLVPVPAGFVLVSVGWVAAWPLLADLGGAAVVLSVGMFASSILERIRGGDDAAEDDDDPLMDDAGLGGDALGDELGGDDLDGFDDWNDDVFGDGEEGAEDGTRELENRIDEVEKELSTLSSTVNTVRSENEQISETVDDVAENVRSLLEIYEMVTRGINPFVDDVSMGSGFESGSFGLFGDDEDEEEEDDLDDSIAGADAEGFFDEELVEPTDDGEFDLDDLDDLDDPDDTDSDTMATEHDTDESKTFSELKDEYETGEADWADDGFAAEDEDEDWDELFEEDEALAEFDETALGAEMDDESNEGFAADDESEASAATAANGHAEGLTDGTGGFEFVDQNDLSTRRRKPYLRTLPGHYVGDLVVMEWLEFLVEHSDATDAVRAVNYYERIEWIDGEVAQTLRAFLEGFGDVDRNLVDEPGTRVLTLTHHTRSLKYIMQLTSATAESVVLDRWDAISEGRHGI